MRELGPEAVAFALRVGEGVREIGDAVGDLGELLERRPCDGRVEVAREQRERALERAGAAPHRSHTAVKPK